MDNVQKQPLKIYIQDVYRAKQTLYNKYIYEMFGLTFKNLMIHGVVTSVYNVTNTTTNLEISDPTGSVHIYYDSTKNKCNISENTLKDLTKGFADVARSGNENTVIMSKLLDCVVKKKDSQLNFQEGDYVSIIGDISLDDLRKIRMVSAFTCVITCIERDVIWLEELKYLYEKFYLWNKE